MGLFTGTDRPANTTVLEPLWCYEPVICEGLGAVVEGDELSIELVKPDAQIRPVERATSVGSLESIRRGPVRPGQTHVGGRRIPGNFQTRSEFLRGEVIER